jgi:hypothetical protein
MAGNGNVTKRNQFRLKNKAELFTIMKRALILLTILGLIATPAMAATKLEATHAPKHAAVKHHATTKKEKKQLKKKLAKHPVRKHKVAV